MVVILVMALLTFDHYFGICTHVRVRIVTYATD